MKLFLQSFLILLVTAMVGCATSDPNQVELITSEEVPSTHLEASLLTNVIYGFHPQQIYDLYLPQGRSATRTKVIVLVHGGGWQSGDKNNMSEHVSYFLDHYLITRF